MAEQQADQAALFGLLNAADERLQHAGAGAPGDVKARHRVARSPRIVAAAFGPADNGEEAQPLRVEPGALLACGKGEVGFGPLARPVVFRTVEPSGAQPVL